MKLNIPASCSMISITQTLSPLTVSLTPAITRAPAHVLLPLLLSRALLRSRSRIPSLSLFQCLYCSRMVIVVVLHLAVTLTLEVMEPNIDHHCRHY